MSAATNLLADMEHWAEELQQYDTRAAMTMKRGHDALVDALEALGRIRPIIARSDAGHEWLNAPEKPEVTPLTLIDDALASLPENSDV